MGVLELLGNLFGGVKEFFSFQNKKLDLNNAPDVKKAIKNQNEQDLIDETNKEIKNKDLEAIRKKLSL